MCFPLSASLRLCVNITVHAVKPCVLDCAVTSCEFVCVCVCVWNQCGNDAGIILFPILRVSLPKIGSVTFALVLSITIAGFPPEDSDSSGLRGLGALHLAAV